jgi:hypothetical protein
MQSNPCSSGECAGLWSPSNGWIIIKRNQLQELSSFAGILLHEALHAKGLSDVSRDFEFQLTQLAGQLAERLLKQTVS